MNLLSMTFGKYMDANLCCFIPGKIMDEIYNVLRILKNTSPSNSRDQKDAPRTYEVLQVWTLEFIFHKKDLCWDRSFHLYNVTSANQPCLRKSRFANLNVFPQIEVLEHPALKIDGFSRTHRTHAGNAHAVKSSQWKV